MKSLRVVMAASAVFLATIVRLTAGGIDFHDPRRALAREDDIRIDAQLARDTVSPGSPIAVVYQIENLSQAPIAIADRIADTSYDIESQIITFSIGSEIPKDGLMPHLVTIAPGEKKTLTAGASVRTSPPGQSRVAMAPRAVQIQVNVLRDLAPFAALIAQQPAATSAALVASAPIKLGDELFERWIQSNDAIYLNDIPVRWGPAEGGRQLGSAENSRP
jgi:hypothetical protein